MHAHRTVFKQFLQFLQLTLCLLNLMYINQIINFTEIDTGFLQLFLNDVKIIAGTFHTFRNGGIDS